MFAPEGYLSLSEIEDIFGQLADNWRLETPNPDDPEPSGIYVPEQFSFIDDNYLRGEAYRQWLFQCFLNNEEGNLYACTPSGNALKLAPAILLRLRVYDGPFPDNPSGWKSLAAHVASPFFYISRNGYRIDFEQARRFSGGVDVNSTFLMLDQLPVCWKLPASGKKIDWMSICGVEKRLPMHPLNSSPAAVAKGILQLNSLQPKLTKQEIKSKVAPTLSVRAFDHAWLLAKQENPSLTRPGRKKS